MKKEQWTEEVLNSVKGLERAEPNPFLFTRIEAKLQQVAAMPRWQLSLAAFGVVLLLAANTVVVLRNRANTGELVNSEYRISGFQSY